MNTERFGIARVSIYATTHLLLAIILKRNFYAISPDSISIPKTEIMLYLFKCIVILTPLYLSIYKDRRRQRAYIQYICNKTNNEDGLQSNTFSFIKTYTNLQRIRLDVQSCVLATSLWTYSEVASIIHISRCHFIISIYIYIEKGILNRNNYVVGTVLRNSMPSSCSVKYCTAMHVSVIYSVETQETIEHYTIFVVN